MVHLKIVSSLEKAFLDENIADFPALSKISVLRGERFSVQCLYQRFYAEEADAHLRFMIPEISGPLAPYARFHRVRSVPVAKTKFPTSPANGRAIILPTPYLVPLIISLACSQYS